MTKALAHLKTLETQDGGNRPMISTIDSRRWALQTVDHGLHAFDRACGQNILVRNRHTAGLQRTAPRVLQIGLLTPCNLHCDFCYRDTSAPSRLNAPFLLDLLTRAAQWGVLEVAFGGGEPLLFRGFVDMVEELHQATALGINFTTNGTLLREDLLAHLRGVIGEMRVSAYPDNRYRRSLLMARGMNVGVNWLVTPANVGMIEPFVYDFLERGARNVLLLGYKGRDSSLHLREQHFALLKQAVSGLQHLPLRLDVCWYPRLADLPHLFARTDCGAGDSFLVITPDRAVQPCSFHHERIPFETFADLQAIHAGLRSRRPATTTAGCTRAEFSRVESPSRSVGVWSWQGRSGNNSGDWTIVGRFREASDATKAAQALRELARAHEAFLTSPEGNQWLIANEYHGEKPTPPLRKFGEAHGFDWTRDDDGLWWEEDGAGAPVLTAGAVGQTVVVYHPYCMGLPEEPFRRFFGAVGAVDFGYWQYDRPHVVARARGNNPDATAALREHLALVGAAEYPSDVKTPPPWGAECTDRRVLDDEDRNARLDKKEFHLEQAGDRLTLLLSFQKPFAGALALEAWLKRCGYSEITIAIEQPLDSLGAPVGPRKEPATNLFGDLRLGELRPLAERLASMTPPDIVETLFGFTYNVPDAMDQGIARIPPTELVRLGRACWARRRHQGTDVTMQALRVIEHVGPAASDWMRELWPILVAEHHQALGLAVRCMAAALPKDEAFAMANTWFTTAREREDRKKCLQSFGNLHHQGTIELIEQWWATAPANEATLHWAPVAAMSEMKWADISRWLASGRPLSLIALGVLEQYVQRGLPPGYVRPSRQEFRRLLTECKIQDPAPRATSAVGRLLENEAKLTEP